MDLTLSRRQTIFGLGLAGLTVVLPRRALTCVATPAQTIGPYYLGLDLLRSDITEGKAGVALQLSLTVVDAATCAPLPGAVVEVWHADALGVYSGFAGEGTIGQTFCRGMQVADANGDVTFVTVYPGWYSGRTPHIHVRVHLGSTSTLVSQVYFPESTTNAVYAGAPYNTRGPRDTTNATDAVLRGVSDPTVVLLAVALESGAYAGRGTIGVDTGGPTSPTTTIAGAACSSEATFATVACALTGLGDAVTTALPDGSFRQRLLRILDRRVSPHVDQSASAAAAGKTRRAQRALVRATAGLRAFRRVLARAGSAQIADATRSALGTTAQQTMSTLTGLGQTLV